MKAITLLVTAFFFVVPSVAQDTSWEQFGETPDAKVFINKASVRNANGMARLWLMSNYNEPKDNVHYIVPARSSKMLILLNCLADRWSLADMIYYDKPNGLGTVVWSHSRQENELRWQSAAPGTAGAAYMEAGCTQ
jgi:hypothetical protein